MARTPAGRAPSPQPPGKLQFPRRDGDGRVVSLPDLLLGVAVWLVVALVILLLFEGVGALLGQGFGHTSGWIAGLLAVWLFAEEYRAWRPVPARLPLAVFGTVCGGTIGFAVAYLLRGLPALVAGFVGVTVAAGIYALLWYFGVRWAAQRSGER